MSSVGGKRSSALWLCRAKLPHLTSLVYAMEAGYGCGANEHDDSRGMTTCLQLADRLPDSVSAFLVMANVIVGLPIDRWTADLLVELGVP